MASQSEYDLKSVKLPRMAGGTLKAFVALLDNATMRAVLLPQLLASAGITGWRKTSVDDAPTPLPLAPLPAKAIGTPANLQNFAQVTRAKPKGLPFATTRDYALAYRTGATMPMEIAERVLDAIADSNAREPALRAIIACQRDDVIAQARASTQRWRDGKPLSIFDGVPVAVKDEIDMLPYGTSVGTKFLGKSPARQDATVVARLRAAGALLIGKANMHEIGIGVTGLNPHLGTTRNPYNPAHFTGGSSSGSATAVAAGLCPVAIGADGGGSIRIPSAFCGVVGIKATYARVSESGAAPLCWSVAHLGPIGATAEDVALAYAIIGGADQKDSHTMHQPDITLDNFDQPDLHGVTLGVFTPWFEHASPAMVEGCRRLLNDFQSLGAAIREIEIPELDAARVAHVVTISSEMNAALAQFYDAHHADYGLDVRTNLSLARTFNSHDYIHAQQIRTRTIAHFQKAFDQVDTIITPMTGVTAPSIPRDALPDGESDLTTLTEIMRFATPPNFTGHPAIAFPAGYDAQGLPVGIQAIGKYWHEHTLLRLARAAEQIVERRAPQVHYKLLA